jgi:hypothetical protein
MFKLMVLQVVFGTVCLVNSGVGQSLSIEVCPSPAPRGTAIQLDIQNIGNGPVEFPDSCILRWVSADAPDGVAIRSFGPCADVLITLDEGGELTAVWDGRTDRGDFAGPGDYWLHVEFIEAGVRYVKAYAARISSTLEAEPRLIQFSDSVLGLPTAFGLLAPDHRLGMYAVAASMSTDVGTPLSVGHLALDFDALWELSFPEPHPQFFQGFQGSFNSGGEALAISVTAPADPRLAGLTIYLQSLAIPASMEMARARLSNVAALRL